MSQVWTVTALVARRLGLAVDSALLAREQARETERARSASDLADRLSQAASHFQMTLLRRSLAEADFLTIARGDALPVVLVTGGPAPQAWVLIDREQELLTLVRTDADGTSEERRVTATEWWAREGGDVLVLVPVPVAPAIGYDAAHGAPSPGARLLALLTREKRDIGIIYFYASLTGLFSLALPLGVQAIVQLVSSGQLLQPVAILIAFVVAGTLASGVLQILQLQVVEVLQQRIFARLAFEFAFRVPRLQLESLRGADLPEMMNRFFEVITIQKSLQKLLTETTTALLQVIFGLILLTFYHPYFTLVGLALVAALWLVFKLTGPKGLGTSLMESKYKYRVAHWLQEMARSARSLKYTGRSTLAVQRMDGEIGDYLKYRKKHFGVLVQQGVAIIAFKTIITGGLLVLGALLVINRQISLGQFVASEIVVVTVLGGLEKLIVSLPTVYDILTSVDKAGHVTDVAIEAGTGLPLPEPAVPTGLGIRTQAVGYAYPGSGRAALRGLSLDLAPNSFTVLTGYDGAGQSTLLKVLAGLSSDYSGALVYDGLSARDLDRVSLRSRVGLVLEHPELFDGTIEENISMGRPDVGTSEVLASLDAVGVREVVTSLPNGLHTRIVDGGLTLPQTVSRKLAIARAIAGRPRLLALDDVLQHFDPGAKQQIVGVLRHLTRHGCTVVVASHDPSVLAASTEVIVLDQGAERLRGPWATVATDPYVRSVTAGQSTGEVA